MKQQQPLRGRRDYGYVDLEEELEKRKKEVEAAKELLKIARFISSIEG